MGLLRWGIVKVLCRIVKSAVLVPLQLQLGLAIKEFGFFHVVRQTGFDAALAYVAFCRACGIGWCPLPSSSYLPFFPYSWWRTMVFARLAVAGPIK